MEVLARALLKNTLSFKGWNLDALEAFIPDGGVRVDCGCPVLPPGKGQGAHLLPKIYKTENRACVCCNAVKGNYDPSGGKELGSTSRMIKFVEDLSSRLSRK